MSSNFTEYRELFPITRTDIYLNHAAISPLSKPVVSAMKAALADRSNGPVDTFEKMLEEKKRLKANIASLIATDPENIALIGNTSEGLNWLVNGLSWKKGDRILLVEGEFPSNVYPFLNMKAFGVEVDFVQTRDGFIDVRDIQEKITGHTRMLSISFVEYFNGFRNDLVKIGQLCDHENILFSVDGIQGTGALPLDVQQAKIDFLSNGGHKWLMGPMGCGFMYIKPQLRLKLRPVFAGWLSVKDSWNFNQYKLDFLDDSGRFETGTPNYIGIVGARAATDLLVAAGPQNIQNHLFGLGDILIDELQKLSMQYLGSMDKLNRSGIYTFAGERVEDLFNLFKENHVHVSVRNGALRISPHFYNQSGEIIRLIELCREFYKS